jgi:hypothetical protein
MHAFCLGVVAFAVPARSAGAAPAWAAAPGPAVPTVAAAPAKASTEGVAAPIPARPVPGVAVPAVMAATPKIRVRRDGRRSYYDRRGNYDWRGGRRRCGIRCCGIWGGVLRLRGPCCELAEHDPKACHCEHEFPTSRHDLLAPLIVIQLAMPSIAEGCEKIEGDQKGMSAV